MATTQLDKEVSNAADHRHDIPGSYFGTDGEGHTYYYQTGSRTMTAEDKKTGERRTFSIPVPEEMERPIVGFVLHIISETEKHWEEVKVNPQLKQAATGGVPVNELIRIYREGDY